MTSRALPNYRWIKFPITCLNDWHFMHLTDAAAGMYVKLYLLAARCYAGGLLCSNQGTYDLEELAWQLRTEAQSLEPCISDLIDRGFLKIEKNGYWIARFMDEQGPGDNIQRQKWAERQRKSRARALKVDMDIDEQAEEERKEDKE